MDSKKLLRLIVNQEPSVDTIGMILSNHVDFGSEAGGLVSVKKFDSVAKDIIEYFSEHEKQKQSSSRLALDPVCAEPFPDV